MATKLVGLKREGADFSPKAPEERKGWGKKHLYVDKELLKKLKIEAAKRDVKMVELAEAAVQLLLVVLEHGIPEDLGILLARVNPELLAKLKALTAG